MTGKGRGMETDTPQAAWPIATGSGVPRVSVIIPFHNAVGTLAGTVASLRSQTFSDWEGLLINDGSTDGSAELAASLAAQDLRLRVLHTADRRKAAGARNLGIRSAQERFIAFLDADDLWLPDKLSEQIVHLEAGAPIVFSSYRRIDAEGNVLSVVPAKSRVSYQDALGGNPIGCLTGVWDRERFGPAQMPELPMHEDYAFWLGLLRQGAVAHGLPAVLAEYRVAKGSLSSRKLRVAGATWRILRREPGLGVLRASWGMVRYALRAMRQRV
jgi:teichuronic acid biosynthesis glycosyltransferase TuaG